MGNEFSNASGSSGGGGSSVGLTKDSLVSFRSRTVRVKKDLAVGGFGAVVLVEDCSTGEALILKRQAVQRDNLPALEVARQEIKVLRALRAHPNITQLLDFNVIGENASPMAGGGKSRGRGGGDKGSLMRASDDDDRFDAGPAAPSDDEGENTHPTGSMYSHDDDPSGGFDAFSGGASGKAHTSASDGASKGGARKRAASGAPNAIAIGGGAGSNNAPSLTGALANLVVFDLLLELADRGGSQQLADSYLHPEEWRGGGSSSGGGLLSSFDTSSGGGSCMPEPLLLQLFRDALLAVAHMHANKEGPITHFDIKVENLLLASGPNGSTVGKVCDFGSSVIGGTSLETEQERREAEDRIERTTTLAYRSPELCDLSACLMTMEPGNRRVGPPADVWALGCLLYRLAYGRTPFEEPNAPGVVQKMAILNGRYSIPATNSYSKLTTGLIKACLTPDPSKRPTVTQLLEKSSQVPLFASLPPPITLEQWQTFKEQAASRGPSRPSGASFSNAPVEVSRGPRSSIAAALGAAVSTVGSTISSNTSRQRAGSNASTGGGGGSATSGLFSSGTLSTVGRALESAKESIEGRMMQALSAGKKGTALDKKRWVLKATSLVPMGPKQKYVRRLILDAYDSSSAGVTLQHLPNRPMHRVPIVAAKGAILTLKLIQHGPSQALSQLAGSGPLDDADHGHDNEEGSDFQTPGGFGGYNSSSASSNGFLPLFKTVSRSWEASLPADFVLFVRSASDARPATSGEKPRSPMASLPAWSSFRGYRTPELEAAGLAQTAGYPLSAFAYVASLLCSQRLALARRYSSLGASYSLDTLDAAISSANADATSPQALKKAVDVALSNLPLCASSLAPSAALSLLNSLMALLQMTLFACNVALAVDDLAVKANAANLTTNSAGDSSSSEDGAGGSTTAARAANYGLERVQAGAAAGVGGQQRMEARSSVTGNAAVAAAPKATDGQACATGCLGALVEEAWSLSAASSLAFLSIYGKPGAANSPSLIPVSTQLQELNNSLVNQLLPRYRKLQEHAAFRRFCEPLETKVTDSSTTFLTQLPHFQKLVVGSSASASGPSSGNNVAAVELALALLSHSASSSSSSSPADMSASASSSARSAVGAAKPSAPSISTSGNSGIPLTSPYIAPDHQLRSLMKGITDEYLASLTSQALQKRANTAACEPANNANNVCCECGSPDTSWASVNLGILLCLACSGAHRQLGTHISVVKSVTLDKWKAPWLVTVLAIGNKRSNAYWEAKGRGAAEGVPGILSPLPMLRPSKNAGMDERYRFCALKYSKATWAADESFATAPSVAERARAMGVEQAAITTPPHLVLPIRLKWLAEGGTGASTPVVGGVVVTPSFGVGSSSSAAATSFDFPSPSHSGSAPASSGAAGGASSSSLSVSLDDFGPSVDNVVFSPGPAPASSAAAVISPQPNRSSSAAGPVFTKPAPPVAAAAAVSASDFDFVDDSSASSVASLQKATAEEDEGDPFAIDGSHALKSSTQLTDYELNWGTVDTTNIAARGSNSSSDAATGGSGKKAASSVVGVASAKPPRKPSFAANSGDAGGRKSPAAASGSGTAFGGELLDDEEDSEDGEGEEGAEDEEDEVAATREEQEIFRLRQREALRAVRTLSSGAMDGVATRALSGAGATTSSAAAAMKSSDFDDFATFSGTSSSLGGLAGKADNWSSSDPFSS
jgi:serine/threonine protein kinase